MLSLNNVITGIGNSFEEDWKPVYDAGKVRGLENTDQSIHLSVISPVFQELPLKILRIIWQDDIGSQHHRNC